ncbi:unnamed protein product [Adineta ricciae]|uniref:Protein-tyrosine phosphatase receptor IA-2 ectodomain domain-containing protein n=1 Tax=Adineta ricciae TaxID=249248 RepID=A0A814JHI6_ADIRI|nr:unnamed protein product [Adineta ricciae]
MTQSSFPFLFSSSFSCHRLVTLITILLLNPLPIIHGAPTKKSDNELTPNVQRHKRDVFTSDDDDGFNTLQANEYPLISETKIIFEGLIGCKYDSNLCNNNEACFDDGLFGQCWDGEGSVRSAFALKSNVDELADDKLIALESTLDFLNRHYLNWRDYMTQCILSHILADTHQINQNRLDMSYDDCLNKDEQLDELAAVQEDDMQRRQLELFDENSNVLYKDPYSPVMKSDDIIIELQNNDGIPVYIEPDEVDIEQSRIPSVVIALAEAEAAQKELEQLNQIALAYAIDHMNDNDAVVPVEEESSMNEPTKVSVHTNEVHPGLIETLQTNNNKQVMPAFVEQTMGEHNEAVDDKILNNTDANRYFKVETAQGYISINRDFKDQTEGGRLLSYIAQMNSWPAAIFTKLNADRRILTFHVANNPYRINASNVASAALLNGKNIENQLGIHIVDSGIGNPRQGSQLSIDQPNSSRLTIITLVTCALVLFTMAAFVLLYFVKRNDRIRNKLAEITHIKGLSTNYYQDLCRQRMQVQPTSSKSPEIHKVHQSSPSSAAPTTVTAGSHVKHNSEGSSTRSSTSSWSEEPVAPVNMDIMTGHLILSYMEDHLRNRHRLEAEWQALCTDEANEEKASCSIALSEANANKNRYIDCIPCKHK